jgi:hypothetical protein
LTGENGEFALREDGLGVWNMKEMLDPDIEDNKIAYEA